MKKLLVLVFLGLASTASAQTSTVPNCAGKPCSVAWEQPVNSLDPVLPGAYFYKLAVDTNAPTAITPTCTAPTAPAVDWTCRTPLPELPAGEHQISIIASASVDGTVHDSGPSDPIKVLVFTFTIQVPKNVRIEQGTGGQ